MELQHAAEIDGADEFDIVEEERLLETRGNLRGRTRRLF